MSSCVGLYMPSCVGNIPEIPKTSHRKASKRELLSCKHNSGFAWLVCVEDYSVCSIGPRMVFSPSKEFSVGACVEDYPNYLLK